MRTRDAEFINSVANHPAVRPHIGLRDAGDLDFAAVAADPANYCLRVDHGVFLFVPKASAEYELHTLLLPEGRGSAVLPAAHQAFGYMFEHGCEALTTYAPTSNRPAALMARRAGFKQTHIDPAAWEDGSDLIHFRMSRAEWKARREAR